MKTTVILLFKWENAKQFIFWQIILKKDGNPGVHAQISKCVKNNKIVYPRFSI